MLYKFSTILLLINIFLSICKVKARCSENACKNDNDSVSIITSFMDYLANPDKCYNICCPKGPVHLFESKIYLTKTDNFGYPIVEKQFTTSYHYPNWFDRFKGRTCKVNEVNNQPIITNEKWINNIKKSNRRVTYYDKHALVYADIIKTYDIKDIYISFLGYCTDSLKLSELAKRDNFVMSFSSTSFISLKCPTRSKLIINSAIVRGDQFCNGGNAYDLTDLVKNECNDKSSCKVDVKAKKPDTTKFCTNNNKIILVDASCKK